MNEPSELPDRDIVRSPQQLRNLLRRHVGEVNLTVTRNRVSMVSVKFEHPGCVELRLNHSFLSAPDHVVDALGTYLKTRSPKAWAVITEFVSSREPEPRLVRPVTVNSKGNVFDLMEIKDGVNRMYFKGAVECQIGWAKQGRRRQRASSRTIRYGTYNKALNLVRINPLLDDVRVPREFMEYIVFHEMLHAVVPSQRGRIRWNHHHSLYRRHERVFPGHERMQKLAGELVRVLAAR